MKCTKSHRYAELFKQLEDSQAEEGRHKCAGCAYEIGFMDGLNNKDYRYGEIVSELPESQAGTVRHKDTQQAYDIGYEEGKIKYKDNTVDADLH